VSNAAREFVANYKQVGKHRRKCAWCGRLIADGEQIRMQTWVEEKYYPVKGIMRFKRTAIFHEGCNGGKA